jgi:hypothetical protein
VRCVRDGDGKFLCLRRELKRRTAMLKAFVACVLGMACMAAQAVTNCHHVGGTVSTNFLDSTTTLGSATGDLAGGLGVSIAGISNGPNGSVVFHNQHHWVTVEGDTINVLAADATGYPSGVPGLYAVSYLQGVTIAGGTGKFENATGKVMSWGAANTSAGEIVLRYEGTVCYANGK